MTDAWEMHPETGLTPYSGSSKVPATFHPDDGPVWRDRGVIIANLTRDKQALEERVAELELAALNLRDETQGAHEREQALRERLTALADRGIGTDVTPTVSGREDVVWWYDYLRSHDSRWRAKVRAALAASDPKEDNQ